MAHKNFQFLWRAHFVEGSLRGGLTSWRAHASHGDLVAFSNLLSGGEF
ncbi:MAG: hypothetical protein KJ592_03530 [Nanoarchaeota archaeon]|nr:hypothetical protein [Nanoarchaeota archaeon]